jgi:tetratricopeptide (TPR) repeat protein
MAYVRQRGNQLAIVRGVRDAATGKVEQQILLTLYSKEEAREAIGSGARRLQSLLRDRYPGVKLPWETIARGISEKLESLPDSHERRDERLLARFGEDLAAFARQIALANPQRLSSAAALIRANADKLAFLRRLIDWRLKTRKARPSEFTRDPHGWRLALEQPGIPSDVEDMASGLYEHGRYKKAKAAFALLLDAFGEDADALNYLGLIALERDRLGEACTQFERAVGVARRSFPRKVAKRSMGRDLETRPYVRALGNLALTQNQLGCYPEALATCDRLEKECGDAIAANAHRAAIGLNSGDYELAWRCACFGRALDPSESLVAALAAHELGRGEDALACFLHGALSNRRAARMLLGERTPEPEDSREARDHNTGVFLTRAIRQYLDGRGRGAVRAIKKIRRSPAVSELMSEMEAVVRRWRGDAKTAGWREAFDRMTKMQTIAFAEEKARDLLGKPADQDAGGE